MKRLNNEQGIALVMALILSLVILATVSALLYLVTQGTMMSGYEKRYQTSLEAAKGGLDLSTKEVVAKTIASAYLDLMEGGNTNLTAMKTSLQADYSEISLAFPPQTTTACLRNKLLLLTKNLSVDNWPDCSADNYSMEFKKSDGTNISDMTFQFAGPTAAQDFTVYAKIVDTTPGNSDTSGLDLQGQGVVESGSGLVAPKQVPYMYRMEMQAERVTNPDERSNLSVIFAY
jgi:hypothetical protein